MAATSSSWVPTVPAPLHILRTRHRLRRLLHRARRHGDVRRGGLTTRARSTNSRPLPASRPRLLQPAAQHRHHHPCAASVDAARKLCVWRGQLKPLRAGEALPAPGERIDWRCPGCSPQATWANRWRCKRPVCRCMPRFQPPRAGAFCAPERFARGAGLRTIHLGHPRRAHARQPARFFQRPGGWNFRRLSGASTNCRPRRLRKTAWARCAGRCVTRSRCLMKNGALL